MKKIRKTKSIKSEGLKNFLDFLKMKQTKKLLVLYSSYSHSIFSFHLPPHFFSGRKIFLQSENSWFSILTDSEIVVNNLLGKFGIIILLSFCLCTFWYLSFISYHSFYCFQEFNY